MAQRTIVTVTDDLTGEPDAERLEFGLDGTQYEIDLTETNAAALRDALAQYVAAARPVDTGQRGKRDRGRFAPAPGSRGNAAAIRRWARENGLEVGERGRIRSEVKDAYREAQQRHADAAGKQRASVDRVLQDRTAVTWRPLADALLAVTAEAAGK